VREVDTQVDTQAASDARALVTPVRRRSTSAAPAPRMCAANNAPRFVTVATLDGARIAQCSVSERGCQSSCCQVANRKRASLWCRSVMTRSSAASRTG